MTNEKIKITYFVHGTTYDNEQHKSSGWNDVELSPLGIRQSKELKNQIKGKKFDVVFCSDLKRAVHSAELTFGKTVKLIHDKRLREVDYGDWTCADSEKIDSEVINHIDKPFPNGESYKDTEKRMRSFLSDIKKKYTGKHVAIVAHRAPQLALDVIIKGMTWEQAMNNDWRLKKPPQWQAGWEYVLL